MLQNNSPKQAKINIPKKQLITAILTGVIFLLFIIFVIKGAIPEQEIETPVDTSVYTSAITTTTPDPISVTDDSIFNTITVPNYQGLKETATGYSSDIPLQFPHTDNIAESNAIQIGRDLVAVPLKSCAYLIEGNKLSIVHSSGSNVTVHRSKYTSAFTTEEIDMHITQTLSSLGAKTINLSGVYCGSQTIGRQGKTEMDIDGAKMLVALGYIFYNNECHCFISLGEPNTSDFIDMIYGTFKIGSKDIVF